MAYVRDIQRTEREQEVRALQGRGRPHNHEDVGEVHFHTGLGLGLQRSAAEGPHLGGLIDKKSL